MLENTEEKHNKVSVLIVGAGPAGLAAAITLKSKNPQVDVCVIEKAEQPGNHNLSGAALEAESLHRLLDTVVPNWTDRNDSAEVLCHTVKKDNLMFFMGKQFAFNVLFIIKIARLFGLGLGQMQHAGDCIVSISKLTRWLGRIAEELGAEILTGFAAEDIILNDAADRTVAVKLVDQGLDENGNRQPNFVEGETIQADFVVLAEGCDGLLTEKFIEKANLQRTCPQLYSVGVKELIKVSSEQYENFGSSRIVHAMGWPIWTPLFGPSIFGGGIMYPAEENHIAVGMIAATDWKYCDFNPQDALANFKQHRFVQKFIKNGKIVEAGAKMIPEGGLYSVPREPVTNTIGKANCIITGDGAGFVNMLKIKGLHNAIDSGIKAATAIADNLFRPEKTAAAYTALIDCSGIAGEMNSAKNYRQIISKFKMMLGLPLSVLGGLLGRFKVRPDYEAMTTSKYRLKPDSDFDKDTFTAMANTRARQEQPSHLKILDTEICTEKCEPQFEKPCITFCPSGVYETVNGQLKAANPSNCLHCKTCQRKCPFDNIRWTVPEGSSGPGYRRM